MRRKRAKHKYGFSIVVGLFLVSSICLFLGCAENRVGMPTFTKDIQSPDPSVRIKAVIYAGNSGDKRFIPHLVDRLEDDDEVVRLAAIESLKQLTGNDFGYRSFDPPYKRMIAVEQWRKWLKGSQPKRKECELPKKACNPQK